MNFLQAAQMPEFWQRCAWLLLLSGLWLVTAVYVGFVFERMRRRQATLDRIAMETRAQMRRVK